mgnify:FL=1
MSLGQGTDRGAEIAIGAPAPITQSSHPKAMIPIQTRRLSSENRRVMSWLPSIRHCHLNPSLLRDLKHRPPSELGGQGSEIIRLFSNTKNSIAKINAHFIQEKWLESQTAY